MSHNVVANGDNPLAKSAKSTLAFADTNTSTLVTESNPSAINSSELSSTLKPSRLNLTLNFGQAGESAKKRTKIENYIQETPELAKIFTDPNPAAKYMLQTPDLAKIGMSTPELDQYALRITSQIAAPTLPTPMTLANFLEDPSISVNQLTGSNVGMNHVTLVNAPSNSIRNYEIELHDDAKLARKKFKSSIVEDQMLQHANNLMMLSSHSEHSISSNDSHPTGHDQIMPIDMDNQEKIKIDRKRERNRIAASRCRQRKLERISTLEVRVKEFREKNDKLNKYIEFLEELIQRRENAFCTHERFNCEH